MGEQVCIKDMVEKIYEVLKIYQNLDSIEIEGRLGIYDFETKKFDTNIGDENFDKIKNMLKTCDKWNSIDNTNTTDYFHNKLRMTVNKETSQRICIEKKKIATFTFVNENLPLDFRFTIAKEDPVKLSNFPIKGLQKLYSRTKLRESYIYKEYQYDLTKIEQEDNDNILESFEFEVEYKGDVDDKSNKKQIIFDIIHKLYSGIWCCDGHIKTRNSEIPFTTFTIKQVV